MALGGGHPVPVPRCDQRDPLRAVEGVPGDRNVEPVGLVLTVGKRGRQHVRRDPGPAAEVLLPREPPPFALGLALARRPPGLRPSARNIPPATRLRRDGPPPSPLLHPVEHSLPLPPPPTRVRF